MSGGSQQYALVPGRAESKLSKDEQVIHALNRLTFGPRPGDVEAVRKMGVKKWIDLQLHPERIAENPGVGAKTGSARIAAAVAGRHGAQLSQSANDPRDCGGTAGDAGRSGDTRGGRTRGPAFQSKEEHGG